MSLATAVALLEAEVGGAFPAAALGYGDRFGARLLCAVGDAGLQTWFDLASLTKALCTSLVALRLSAAGRLDLGEEVLPGVTVEHLLCHAAGLPPCLPLHEAAPAEASTEAARRAVVAAAAAAERGPAGARSVYSDLGFILLGDLLEHRGGERLDRLFSPIAAACEAEVAFRPIGEPAAVPAAACAETRREGPVREPLLGLVHDDNARAMGGVAGHAGLFGTAPGVLRLAAALLRAYHDECPALGALGIRASLLRRFFSPCAVPGSTWGLGWDHPDPRPGASSAGDLWPRDGVGHLGFTGCSLWLDPAGRRLALLLSNRVCQRTPEAAAEAQARMKALRPRVHDALLEPGPEA